jgi:hypothetical protein
MAPAAAEGAAAAVVGAPDDEEFPLLHATSAKTAAPTTAATFTGAPGQLLELLMNPPAPWMWSSQVPLRGTSTDNRLPITGDDRDHILWTSRVS